MHQGQIKTFTSKIRNPLELRLDTIQKQSLLSFWEAFFVLDFGLDVLDGIAGLHFKCEDLAGEHLYKDLHGHVLSQIMHKGKTKNCCMFDRC